MGPEAIFSIDVPAHLAKLSSSYFRSPDHYLVELARLALRRGARRIAISISRTRVEMEDDGRAQEREAFPSAGMMILASPLARPEEKESVIASMLDGKGIGWLALFAPRPQRIEWEPATIGFAGNSTGWIFEEGHWRSRKLSGGRSQNRLLLVRERREWQGEATLVEEYCRFSSAAISLNGRPLEKEREIGEAMASLCLPGSIRRATGKVWIPREGKSCRIWRLDHGVICGQEVRPPVQGMIFEAALEDAAEADDYLFDGLAERAFRLYSWLAEKYPRYPDWAQQRVDDLFFTHFRRTGDEHFLHAFSPFRLLSPPSLLSLEEVRRLGDLFAVQADEEVSSPSRQRTFSLTRQQWDFLANTAGIRVHFVQAPPRARPRFHWLYVLRVGLRRKGSNLLTRLFLLLLGGGRDGDGSTFQHGSGVETLRRYFRDLGEGVDRPVEVVVVSWPGFSPCRRLVTQSQLTLFLRPSRPGLSAALALLERSPREVGIVASWLAGPEVPAVSHDR